MFPVKSKRSGSQARLNRPCYVKQPNKREVYVLFSGLLPRPDSSLSLKHELHLVGFPNTSQHPSRSPGPNAGAPAPAGRFSRSSLRWAGLGPQGQTRSYEPLQQALTAPGVQHRRFAPQTVALCCTATACSGDDSPCLAVQLSQREVRNRFVSETVADFLCSGNNQRNCLKGTFSCQALQHPCANSVTAVTGGENQTQGEETLLQFPEERHLTRPRHCGGFYLP